MKTITNDEDYVRLRIFEGDLKIDDAGKELLRLEKDAHAVTRAELLRIQNLLERRTA